ncbi:MAG TPA: ABC transporter permease, partial [Cellvibrio sp.]|nr:ABC transporter permease [Cellvibrio sp.]
MLTNYLKIALRNLFQSKVHSFVSIFGLALGLAATTVILIVNYSELTWDRNWKDVDRIYELEQIYMSRTTPTKVDTIASKTQLDKISEYFSDIEHIGHINFTKGDVKVNIGSTAKFNENINAITTNILDIFSLKAIQGSTTDFYTDKQSVIISEAIAKKLFAHEDPIGKTLEITWPAFANTAKLPDDNFNYKIIAVIANSPTRSSLKQSMDILVNERYPATPYDPNMLVMSDSNSTYVKLKEGAKPENINSKFSEFLDTNKIGLGQNETKKASEVFTFKITNLRKVHLYGFNSSNNIQRIFILYCLAAVIATLAAVNYINLTTARFARRQKEISLRKTLGATKAQIIAQFLIESLLSVACALLITFIILEPMLPLLSSLLALNIELSYFSDLSLLGIIFGSALCLGLCSGFYPGFILSRIKPAVILKANKSHESSGSIKFRNLLVIFQFSISAAMLV